MCGTPPVMTRIGSPEWVSTAWIVRLMAMIGPFSTGRDVRRLAYRMRAATASGGCRGSGASGDFAQALEQGGVEVDRVGQRGELDRRQPDLMVVAERVELPNQPIHG